MEFRRVLFRSPRASGATPVLGTGTCAGSPARAPQDGVAALCSPWGKQGDTICAVARACLRASFCCSLPAWQSHKPTGPRPKNKVRSRSCRGNSDPLPEIGRAHVGTPVTNAHLVCRLLLEKKKKNKHAPPSRNYNTIKH